MPDRREAGYSVGEAARLAGVTVRTLHHYGEIGLLVPAGRSAAGYRQYSDADLDRLARILYYRELDFSLEDIATMLGDGAPNGASVSEHLARQHKLLSERLRRTQAMVASIEREMEARMTGNPLTPEQKLEIFGADYDPSWEAEAEQRWGSTAAWKESQRRTAQFSQDDWKQVKANGDAFDAELAAAFRSGAAPDSPVAMELAEKHRGMVGQFYDCSYAMHRGLADMYLADERFTANYERVAPGLAQWVHDAIHANADRHPDEQGTGWGR
jgi:DNA-binding transcriptional MerR regulator